MKTERYLETARDRVAYRLSMFEHDAAAKAGEVCPENGETFAGFDTACVRSATTGLERSVAGLPCKIRPREGGAGVKFGVRVLLAGPKKKKRPRREEFAAHMCCGSRITPPGNVREKRRRSTRRR